LVVVSPVTAARNPKGKRTEKEHKLRDEIFEDPRGIKEVVEIWTSGGRLCQRVFATDGSSSLVPLRRKENKLPRNLDGTYRSYVYYAVPDPFGSASRVIAESTLNDPKRDGKFNRAENIRQIPPGDPDYAPIKGRRSDAESINRDIDDRQPLGRARAWSATRQLIDAIGYARATNSLTWALYIRKETTRAA
jgi:hypothetical protein